MLRTGARIPPGSADNRPRRQTLPIVVTLVKGIPQSGDQEAAARALDAVLAAGKEFRIPVALNMPEDVPKRFQQGARMFVGIGATYRPPPAEVRQSVGR